MQQYFAKDKNLNLYETDYHHIKNVMRMKKGDMIKVVYDNYTYLCKINEIKDDVKFEVLKKEENIKKEITIIIAFSLLKEQKLDYLLQKATEVGADEFIPIITSRTLIKCQDKNKKQTRWQRIVKEASEQCNRLDIPKINDIFNIKELVNYEANLKILCTLNEKTKNIKKILAKNNKCDKILIVIGPEGGFTKDEEEVLIKSGFLSCSIGNNVLRSETAPVAIISMINYEFMR